MSGAPHFAWAMDIGRELKLPTSERIVLMVLAERANGSRECWPSLPKIADDTGLSPRTVHTAVHKLEDRGLIRIENRGRGSLHYRILRPTQSEEWTPRILQPMQDQGVEILQPVQGEADSTPCNHRNSTPEIIASESLKEPPKHSSAHASAREGRADADASQGKVPGHWIWSKDLGRFVPPPEPVRPAATRSSVFGSLALMGSPGPNGTETINGIDVAATARRACELARIDPAQAMHDQCTPIRVWLRAGVEACDIFEVIRKAADRPGYNPPFSLGWFKERIMRRQPARDRSLA